MQKCCGTYVPQHFLCLLTIRSLNIIHNKDKKKQPQKYNPQKKHIKRTVKDELLQSSNFILPRVFSPLFDF